MITAYISFDGSSLGNPGKCGAGALIELRIMGKVVDTISISEPLQGNLTSNQAEYWALLLSLRKIHTLYEPEEVNMIIVGDSQLVVNQIKGINNVRSKKLKPIWKKCTDILQHYCYHISWIPRAQNSAADRLARAGADIAKERFK